MVSTIRSSNHPSGGSAPSVVAGRPCAGRGVHTHTYGWASIKKAIVTNAPVQTEGRTDGRTTDTNWTDRQQKVA